MNKPALKDLVRKSCPPFYRDVLSFLRKRERRKYDEHYFRNVYWQEDFLLGDHDHSMRFSVLTDLILKYFPKPKKVLDIGCGMGHIVKNMRNTSINCLGTEVSKWALDNPLKELVNEGIVVECGADYMPLNDNEFDLIICTDVLEHIPEFFDIYDVHKSIFEIARVGSANFFITINLDHKYEYHPTIRNREWWENIFISTGLSQTKSIEAQMKNDCIKEYPEYDFFIYINR